MRTSTHRRKAAPNRPRRRTIAALTTAAGLVLGGVTISIASAADPPDKFDAATCQPAATSVDTLKACLVAQIGTDTGKADEVARKCYRGDATPAVVTNCVKKEFRSETPPTAGPTTTKPPAG